MGHLAEAELPEEAEEVELQVEVEVGKPLEAKVVEEVE